MKDTDQLLEFTWSGQVFYPSNELTLNLTRELIPGQKLYSKEQSERNLS